VDRLVVQVHSFQEAEVVVEYRAEVEEAEHRAHRVEAEVAVAEEVTEEVAADARRVQKIVLPHPQLPYLSQEQLCWFLQDWRL
jgi:hypothetical protein